MEIKQLSPKHLIGQIRDKKEKSKDILKLTKWKHKHQKLWGAKEMVLKGNFIVIS